MKKINTLLLLCTLSVSIFAGSITVNDGDDIVKAPSQVQGDNVTVKNGGRLTVTGDVYFQKKLVVEAGGTLVIQGSLREIASGNESYLSGNVIVLGDLTLANVDMLSDANIIITGEVAVYGNKTDVSANADIYAINDENPLIIGVDSNDLSLDDIKTGDDLISDLGGDDSGLLFLVDDLMEEIISVAKTNTWNGDTSEAWTTGANWSLSDEPKAFDIVVVANAGSSPVINGGSIMVGNLTINENATLTIGGGCQLTINGNLTINGDLVINNTADNPTPIIVKGEVLGAGEATVKWNGISDSKWWYIGLSAMPSSGLKLSDDDGNEVQNGYFLYNYVGASFAKLNGTTYNFTEPLDGYAFGVRDGYPGNLSYSGTLNNEAEYTISNLDEGWYLVANPYPAFIDILSIDHAFTNLDPSYYSTYIWAGTDYATCNLADGTVSGGGLRHIAPGQSFWIKIGAGGNGSITLKKSALQHQPSVTLKSAGSVETDVIRLRLLNNNTDNEAVISFKAYGAYDFTVYDSQKRMVGGSAGNLYTVKDDRYAVINSMPLNFDSEIIPLGYKVAESGMSEFTIQVGDLSGFNSNVDIYLEDLDAGVTINLREQGSYTFAPTAAHSDDRFVIRTELSGVTTDVAENEPEVSKSNVIIYAVNQKAFVKVTEEVLRGKDRLIQVYNLAGQLMAQHELHSTETEFDMPAVQGMYIIRVSVDKSSYQEKVVVY
ncbi:MULTISPECIES: T9SS type A sorting domain-containing protein [unclassified Saccharicrinis]|uniref:T9SS type A sorting domain-containing protein n=1 Tax=unclassified Saccharicrinis TaxID=2646859 RepID=UPI003D34AE2B